ncbi:MAG: hypothetical protein ACTSPH_05565 [Promethearchaeota archaeon]
MSLECNMVKQGYEKGACNVTMEGSRKLPVCQATLKFKNGMHYRLIKSMHLSRPEDYFSIYQSGCNHDCQKCHSHEFTKIFNGKWYSIEEIANYCKQYEKIVTLKEPRKRALMYYALDWCKHCGSCVLYGKPGPYCPEKLSKEQIVLSPQGFGPARNIIAFAGGDIACRAEFYAKATIKIKEKCNNLWVLLETNGYGLTTKNLDIL